jgi:hypothetical protein
MPNVYVLGAEGAEGIVVGGSHASHAVVDVELVQGSWCRGEVVWMVVGVEEVRRLYARDGVLQLDLCVGGVVAGVVDEALVV